MTKNREKLGFDPETMEADQVYKILSGCIVPRPIGLISTVSGAGVLNLAPFSFFNGISHLPPMVCFSSAQIQSTHEAKDTLNNVIETGEFVANIVDEDLSVAQSICATQFPPEVDEFETARLTPIPSKMVRAPRVAESPVNLECRLIQIVPLPESVYTLVIGRVCYMHLNKELLLPNGRIDMKALRAVGRMAGDTYTRTRDMYTHDYNSFEHLPQKRERAVEEKT